MPHHDTNGPGELAARVLRRARQLAAGSRPQRPPDAAAPAVPDGGAPLTTLDATIRPYDGPGYLRLRWAPGEPYLLREDLGATAGAERAATRRSMLYIAHHTDTHVCDAQAPSRLEPGERFAWFNPGADGGHRPQETCTAQVLDQMVRATNAVKVSPLTGAEMAYCVQTGDNTDNRTTAETRWFLDVLDGRPTTPDTGAPGVYEGVQRNGPRWAFQADGPSPGIYDRAGFPSLPGFLDAAVAPFEPVGLEVPWLAVMGNHDAVFLGTFGPMPGLRFDRYGEMLVGAARKPISAPAMVLGVLHASFRGTDPRRWDERRRIGTIKVTADPEARRPLDLVAYLEALLAPPGTGDDEQGASPGPVGHGFSDENVRDRTAWWSRPHGDRVQLIGIDTCNHTGGSEGAMSEAQYRWLEAELSRHSTRWFDADGRENDGDGPDRLCVLFSHHNSWTMVNKSSDELFPGRRYLGGDVLSLLHRFPNVVLWVNGHSHEHRIVAHPQQASGSGGFWEVNTASCIDFGQQARTIELLDNADGTLSLFTTVLDHAAPPSIDLPDDGRWSTEALASMSRELSANDAAWFDPFSLLGQPGDRNTELLVAAPFEL